MVGRPRAHQHGRSTTTIVAQLDTRRGSDRDPHCRIRHRRSALLLASLLAASAWAQACSSDEGPILAASVSVAPAVDSTVIGGTRKLTAVVRDADGQDLVGGITWSSWDTTIARVDTSGLVTTLQAGTATITAMRDGVQGSAQIVVLPVPVASVTIAPSLDTLVVGGAVQLVATTRDSAGNVLTGRPVTWSTSVSRVATVNANGLVTARDSGAATISASSGGSSGGAAITVTLVPVATVSVSPGSVSFPAGATALLRATPRDSAGNVVTGRAVSWSSSNASVAQVRSSGVVIGVAAGTDTVTATIGGASARAVVTVMPAPAARVGWYVSPGGSSGGGSIADPWDLATALTGGAGKVQPGDTVWLRGGTYVGAFRSTLAGGAGRPIVVRRLPGERAIIDGVGTSSGTSILRVGGTWVEFWELELTNSDPVRSTSSTAHDARPDMIANYASHAKYIDLVVHDGGVAFYNDASAGDVEIAGCIIYDNGWQGPDRGHGHGIYLHSNAGPVIARDNVVFNQFGYGLHAYVDPGTQLIDITMLGNVSFNNGLLSTNSSAGNLLLGGNDRATGDVIQDNMTYFSPAVGDTNMQVGFGRTANGTVTVQGNRIVGGSPVLWLGNWDAATLGGNVLAGTRGMVALGDSSLAGYSWGATRYYRDPTGNGWSFLGVSYPLLAWIAATGLGAADLATPANPGSPDVIVRNDTHQAGRAIVVVYNWTQQGAVSADLSGVLSTGDSYTVRNVQDLFGAPVSAGTYGGGTITIPMSGVAPPVPVGLGSSRAPRTAPGFDVFLITRP